MASSTDFVELENDLNELKELEKLSKRPKIKDFLNQEIKKLEKIVENKNSSTPSSASSNFSDSVSPKTQTQMVSNSHVPTELPLVKLTTYAWDQSDKFMKIYLTVPKIESITDDQIVAEFQKKSFEITAKNVNGKNYQLSIKGLLHEIVPEQSSFKIKKDTLLINLHKEKKQNWGYVTEHEQKSKDKQMDGAKPDAASEDPQAGLMTLMKQMYDSGDDEMKRTIKKAWCEAQDKKKGVPDLDDM